MSFRSVTTTLSSLRTTTCDALIVPSINIFHVISITSVNKTLKHAGKTFTKLYYRVILITNEIFVKMKVYHTIPLNPTTSGSRGGAHPARAPPNGRGPMIFYAQNAIFSHFYSSLASLATNFKHDFYRNMAKNTLK